MKEARFIEIGYYHALKASKKIEIDSPKVLLPGFIDAHTHACFAGTRSKDYALRLSGKTYLEIAASGGGVWDTVLKTRAASEEELVDSLLQRAKRMLSHGVTTCEVKSGYGLNVTDEIKMLKAIKHAAEKQSVDLIPTCLAAHMRPKEFDSSTQYLNYVVQDILMAVKSLNLSKRVDIVIEKNAFSALEAKPFIKSARDLGFTVCIHADQFTRGASLVAAETNAFSADHLEESNDEDFIALKKGKCHSYYSSWFINGIRFAIRQSQKNVGF